ncbi:MAG TPA: hypothetical protein VN181_06820 [Thermoanaerobaculia bacterium]|nr:hypothetical protein [Thermoanaerobaculia bacterium]
MLEFRPRPPLWRVALLSASQIVIAVWLTSIAVAALEISALQRWIFYATPWDTPWHRLGVRWIDVDPKFIGPAAAGTSIIAAVSLWLWPTRQTLASRHFAHIAAAVLAIFGALRLATRAPLMYAAPAIVAAIVIAFVAERRAQSLLGNVFDGRRLALWCVRILPAAAFLAFMSWVARDRVGLALAGIFAAITFVVAFVTPPRRFEQLTDVELSAGVIPLAIAAFVVIAGCVALFGVDHARAIFVTPKGWAIRPLLSARP